VWRHEAAAAEVHRADEAPCENRVERRGWLAGRVSAWLVVFGQSALFFYLIHIHLLVFSARALGVERQCGLGVTLWAMAGTLVVMNPICGRYHAYKVAHPRGWTRFL
jgi:hypothetical protein